MDQAVTSTTEVAGNIEVIAATGHLGLAVESAIPTVTATPRSHGTTTTGDQAFLHPARVLAVMIGIRMLPAAPAVNLFRVVGEGTCRQLDRASLLIVAAIAVMAMLVHGAMRYSLEGMMGMVVVVRTTAPVGQALHAEACRSPGTQEGLPGSPATSMVMEGMGRMIGSGGAKGWTLGIIRTSGHVGVSNTGMVKVRTIGGFSEVVKEI